MLSIVQLKTTALDVGIPGISQVHMLLIFGMMLAISMIPYFFLYLSLREQGRAPVSRKHSPIVEKITAWVHAHRHPQLLHH